MPTLRGAGRPRILSCSLSCWTQASSGLEDVSAPYAVGLGMLTWAQHCRQRSCVLLAPICLSGSSFSLSLFLNFPWHANSYRKEKASPYLDFSRIHINPWGKLNSQDPPHLNSGRNPPIATILYYSWTLFNNGRFLHSQKNELVDACSSRGKQGQGRRPCNFVLESQMFSSSFCHCCLSGCVSSLDFGLERWIIISIL